MGMVPTNSQNWPMRLLPNAPSSWVTVAIATLLHHQHPHQSSFIINSCSSLVGHTGVAVQLPSYCSVIYSDHIASHRDEVNCSPCTLLSRREFTDTCGRPLLMGIGAAGMGLGKVLLAPPPPQQHIDHGSHYQSDFLHYRVCVQEAEFYRPAVYVTKSSISAV